MKADLHVHTIASDGILTPFEIVEWAYKKNIKAIGITDHDTIEGISTAIESAKQYNIIIVPGIE
ncbi:MAG: PHP domain-containing protein, partial [Gottschalkiaceae bacterium]